jgi:hypothetical protein
MAEARQQQAVAAGGAWKTVKPFVNGGASGMLATCVIQPIDMIKVRTSSHATMLSRDSPVRPRAGAVGAGYGLLSGDLGPNASTRGCCSNGVGCLAWGADYFPLVALWARSCKSNRTGWNFR